MDLKATLGGYFEKTPIPAELAPEKIAGFVKPRAVAKKTVATHDDPDEEKKPAAPPKSEAEPAKKAAAETKTAIDASAFIKIVRYHHLTGSEFLSLLGNSKIGNKAYQEIEQNPGLTVKRLIELLEESSLTSEDYEKLIIAVQRTAQLKQEAKAKLEAAKPASAPAPAPAPAPASAPTPAPAPKLTPAPSAAAEMPEEKPSAPAPKPVPIWEQKQAQAAKEAEEKPDSILLTDDYDYLYGEDASQSKDDSEDEEDGEDKGKPMEYLIDDEGYDDDTETGSNKGKFIAAAIAALVLIAISFGIRYYFTGSLLPAADEPVNTEQSLDSKGIFNAVGSLEPQSSPAFAENKSYTAGGYTDDSALVRSVTTNNRFIYYSDNTLYIFEKLGGQLEQLDARRYGEDTEILGLLQLDGGVAVVTVSDGRAYGFSYLVPDENGANTTVSSTVQRPETLIELLDAAKPENRSGIRLFGFSGTLADLWTEGDRIIAVTWEGIAEGAAAQDAYSFMPYSYANTDGTDSKTLCNAENVLVADTPRNGGFVTAFSLNLSDGSCVSSALAGGSGQLVSKSGNDLFIGQGELLVRYDLSDGIRLNGSCTVTGTFGGFSAVGVSDGEIRVTALEGGSAALTVLDGSLKVLSEVKNLGNGETPLATCYNGKETYLITEAGTLYGIDGNNETMTASSANVTDAEILKLNDSVGIKAVPLGDENGRTGISVSTVTLDGFLNVLSAFEISSRTVAENALDGYISSPAETDASVMGTGADGVLVVPVVYYDGVSEVERFFILNVTSEGTISYVSSVSVYDRQASLIFATVDEGIVTAVTGERLITARSADGSIIGYFNASPAEEDYSCCGE